MFVYFRHGLWQFKSTGLSWDDFCPSRDEPVEKVDTNTGKVCGDSFVMRIQYDYFLYFNEKYILLLISIFSYK